jgi:hypothetical protein
MRINKFTHIIDNDSLRERKNDERGQDNISACDGGSIDEKLA